MADADMIGTVAEALAGVTITDPDFDGLEREDWRELAAAALKTIREHDGGESEAPEGADLAYLSDRARAYVVGLEARLKTLRQENDELRAKLADPSQRDEKAIRGAYTRGWRDCAAKLASRTQNAIQSLTHCHNAALAEISWPPSPKHSKADLKGPLMIPAHDIDYAAVAHLAAFVRLTTRNGWRDSFAVDATPETNALTDPELIALCGQGDAPFGGSVKRGDPHHKVTVYTD